MDGTPSGACEGPCPHNFKLTHPPKKTCPSTGKITMDTSITLETSSRSPRIRSSKSKRSRAKFLVWMTKHSKRLGRHLGPKFPYRRECPDRDSHPQRNWRYPLGPRSKPGDRRKNFPLQQGIGGDGPRWEHFHLQQRPAGYFTMRKVQKL